jgi:hypothetical protein
VSKHSKAVTVSGKQSQNQTQTGLTSDQQFDNKDKDLNQRKVIEDKDKDNDNSNDNNIIDISLKLIEDTNSLSVNNSAQTIESTNNTSFIDNQNIVNHSSGDQQLATITTEDTIIIEDDMNHVTQNDKQLRPNETQQDEEMMDTAMDDSNALKNDGIFSFTQSLVLYNF